MAGGRLSSGGSLWDDSYQWPVGWMRSVLDLHSQNELEMTTINSLKNYSERIKLRLWVSYSFTADKSLKEMTVIVQGALGTDHVFANFPDPHAG